LRLRDPDLGSPVLEAEHLLDARMVGQVPGPVDPHVEYQARLVVGQIGEGQIVVAGEADHLAPALAGN